MKYYKFLTEEHLGKYSRFDYTAYLPKNGKPGKWLPKVDSLLKCSSGYHACEPDQVARWINAELYEVEYRTKPEGDGEKVWGNKIRLVRKVEQWDERMQRLFAVWCAREALKLVEKPDPRSIAACDVAERYANSEATKEEMDAAYSAARAAADAAYAAYSAADAAARAAAYAAQSKKLLEMAGEP